MNIAILTESLDAHSGSRAPLELAKSLAQNNKNKITIYAREKSDNDNVENLPSKIKIQLIPKGSVFKIFLSLIRDFNRQNYDIISSNATFSVFLPAALSNKPLVTTYHGTQWNVWGNKYFTNKNLELLLHFMDFFTNIFIWIRTCPIFLFSKKVITISKYTSREAKRYYLRPSQHVYWGAVSAGLKPISKNTKNKPSTVISVSRITPYKGFHKLINIFKEIDPQANARLIIVGSQPQKNYLKYLKKISPKNVQIIIDPPDKILASLYKKSHIYATCDRYLFFGMPILEAASNGLPAVCLSYAAAKEVIKNKQTGFVANNLDEFKKYLELLLKDQKLLTSMGERASVFAKKFTWEKTAKEYEKIFKNLLQKNKHGHCGYYSIYKQSLRQQGSS